MAKKKAPPAPKPRSFEDAMNDLSKLLVHLNNNKQLGDKVGDAVVTALPALKLDPEETFYDAVNKVQEELTEFYDTLETDTTEKLEALKEIEDEYGDKSDIAESMEKLKDYEKRYDGIPNDLRIVTLDDCRIHDYPMESDPIAIYGGNLRDDMKLKDTAANVYWKSRGTKRV